MRQLTNPPRRRVGHPVHEVAKRPRAGERREAIWCRDVARIAAAMLATAGPSGLFWQYVTHPALVEYATGFFGFLLWGHEVEIVAVDDLPPRLPAFAVTVDDRQVLIGEHSAHDPIAVLADAVARGVLSAVHGPAGEVRT
ncbi:hypothetical protein R8Z50_22870 [Longispora sp. K20-0274]|uniref:hypothetical protein n=1 Tax=Longispora sp. K20-0274 TaxID=3088255 RepID=UPI00399BFA67